MVIIDMQRGVQLTLLSLEVRAKSGRPVGRKKIAIRARWGSLDLVDDIQFAPFDNEKSRVSTIHYP